LRRLLEKEAILALGLRRKKGNCSSSGTWGPQERNSTQEGGNSHSRRREKRGRGKRREKEWGPPSQRRPAIINKEKRPSFASLTI